jgi:hypothetical protein
VNPLRKIVTFGVALGLIVFGYSQTKHAENTKRSWLGPFAPIAAQVQWVRAEQAIASGFPGRAIDFMESAVDLNPKSGSGWITLADHLGLYLASAEAGWPMETRAYWLETALEVTRRGQSWARHPDALAFHRGMLLLSHARLVEPLTWRDSPHALWEDAVAAFDEAEELGHPGAEAAAEYARAQIQQ